MADVMNREARSRLMSRIKQRNTAPELTLRKGLHRLGLRYRVNVSGLPGRPDLVFPQYRVTLFVHGCFWHGHTCRAGRRPSTHTDFWSQKLADNVRRDRRKVTELRRLGWSVFTVWECKLKHAPDAVRSVERIARAITDVTRPRPGTGPRLPGPPTKRGRPVTRR